MRSIAVFAALLSLAAGPCAWAASPHEASAYRASAPKASAPKASAHGGVSGQCRGRAGEAVRCGAGASTDIEGVPLAAKAAVIKLAAAGQTDAPVGATARCRDGAYSLSKTRGRACARAGGVARWIR